MAKKNRVIVLEQEMIKHPAWLSLSGTAIQVFLIFRTKCVFEKMRNCKPGKRDTEISNNGEIVFTYQEAKSKYGITSSRFTRAIDDLLNKGFIDISATGMGVHKVTTYYAIGNRWRNYGTPEFKEVIRPKPTLCNPGFKKKSSNENACGATRKNVCGEILTIRTNACGQKVEILYKFNKGKWLSSKIA